MRRNGSSVAVPERVTLRIDRQLRQQLLQEMVATGGTLSQTLRLALTLGLERQEEMPVAFRRASFREGVIAGIAAYREAGGGREEHEMKQRALGGIDAALAGWSK